MNDSRLRDIIRELDETIKNNKKERFQSYENRILTSAKNFEIISNHEFESLKRIKDDRNRCEHPSFNNLEEPYNPSPELARNISFMYCNLSSFKLLFKVERRWSVSNQS